MTVAGAGLRQAPTSWSSRALRWLLAAVSWSLRGLLAVVWALILFLTASWATLAVYYSNLPWPWLRLVLAVAFAAFSVYALCLYRVWRAAKPLPAEAHPPQSPSAASRFARRLRWPPLTFAGLFVIVLVWFISISPSHDRPWRPEVAVMPRAVIDGDRVHLTGFRNFDYRTRYDFTERWEERDVSLAHLTSVDLYISYWSVGPVGHTFVSFNFDNAPPVCISIETKPEKGEGFAPVASLFKQFELIYVVGDERDLVRSRTNFRNEEVYLYLLRTGPEPARRLFLVYLDRINELADQPEFYNLLKNSCTINVVRYANRAGRVGRWDLRHLLNGWADRYLYDAGLVDTSLPFEELRRRSHINDVARAADDDPDFSRRIRASLPGGP